MDRLILEQDPDAIVVTSRDGEILHWNNAADTLFGFSRSEALGENLNELVAPVDPTVQEDALGDTPHDRAVAYESVRHRRDGSLVYLDVTTKRLLDEQRELLLHVCKDVTDLKARREAKLVEARFRNLLESTPDAIIMVNPAGRIVLANSQAEELFGYERGELGGEPVEILLPVELRDSHIAHRARYFSQPRTRAMGAGLELNGLRKDGTSFAVEISLSPLETEEGTLVMSAVRDIGERKRIENDLHEKNIELEHAAQAKNRFLATMSHELRTPLNAIIGFTGTLLMKLPGPLTEQQEKQLNTIQSSARHLLALINDLLDLAKIESGRIELDLEPVSCGAVIDEVAESLRPLAAKKNLQFDVKRPEHELRANTDRRALSQIVINLVNNAIKYTSSGGVMVKLYRHQEEEQSFINVDVEDTGCGISNEDQARLFQAFSQLDSSSTREHEGTGLGLHLSQQLASLIGGEIRCASVPGRGSTFTLSVPEH